jgi:hypothetical protein
MSKWDGDGHVGKGRLGLVDSTQRAFVVDGVRLYVVAAFLLVAREGGDGEGGPRGIGRGVWDRSLLGGVGERQGGRGEPLMRGRCLGRAVGRVGSKRGGP